MSAFKVHPLAPTKSYLPCRVLYVAKSKPDGLVERVQKMMLQHVDINPEKPTGSVYTSPQEEQVKKAERFVLDPWSSTSFHATGVAVAFLFAVFMILNSPLSM